MSKKKLSKAERKALEKIAAKKAAKKAAKRAAAEAEKAAHAAAEKPKKKAKATLAPGQVETPEQVRERGKPKKGKAIQEALDADTAAGKKRRAEKPTLTAPSIPDDAETATKTVDEIDAQIKARLEKKREARAADEPGSKERLDALQKDVAVGRGKRAKKVVDEAALDEAQATVAEALDEAKEKLADLKEARDEIAAEATPTVAVEVQFAKPSDGAFLDFEVNGNKQYIVKRPSDGKLVGYTRVTTYISCLEDTTRLTEWKLRLLLEGVAAAEEGGNDATTARIRDLVHRRDVAIAKARKQDRKGKLVHGQLATIVNGAMSDYKRAMNELADHLFELGGGREAATKGTDLHALCDVAERDGIAAVNDKLERGEITPSDFEDVTAYVNAIKRLGAKVTAVEQTIVNHDLKVAGRLDRVVLVKLPQIVNARGEVIYEGDARARRYVLDLKTGRVDYSQGKIAQQIRLYAESQAYDLETHETTSHGANRTHGLVLHIAAGSGEAHLHLVDLTNGAHGNKLAGEVRSWRNTGKRAIDVTTDILGQIEAA